MTRRTTTPTATGVRVVLEPAAEAYAFIGADSPLQRIAVTEVTLREGELLAEVELATVCESDLHTVLGHRAVAVPRVLGHEQVARIVAAGPGAPAATVDGVPLSVGDRIVWATGVACGDCARCVAGAALLCEHPQRYGHERVRRGWELSGGLATHVHLLAHTAIVRARDWIPAAVLAPASCGTATAVAVLEAAESVRPLAGETVLVAGCELLGVSAVALARDRGARVIAVDADERRRDLALRFGATAAFAPGRAPDGYGVALELSGDTAAVADLVEGADASGVIVLAGASASAEPAALPVDSAVRRSLTVRGVGDYRPEHLLEAVRFLERSDHDLFAGLVGDIVSFDDAPRALTNHATRGARTGVRP